jgi:copper chaperone CopZ
MKIKVLSIVTMILFGTSMVFAQAKTENFEVKGNCGMCENRIEKAVKSVDGVTTADWNKETKILEVSFDESKTSVNMVQMEIAKAGHDTPMHKATDEAYDALPGCCQFDRSEVKKDDAGHEGHKH